ncbi:MAG: hypothetical protein ORN21_01860, partial [Methylophilaceae bacterium]|nr:hypothetical protein [Methylophilaceae bacterium]
SKVAFRYFYPDVRTDANGLLADDATAVNPILASFNSNQLGKSAFATSGLVGAIGGLTVYDNTRTAAQIAADAQSVNKSATATQPSVTGTNVVATRVVGGSKVTLDASAALMAGDVLTITATMSDTTAIVGVPKLGLSIGSTTGLVATYTSGSDSKNIVFTYTVLAAQANNLQNTVAPASTISVTQPSVTSTSIVASRGSGASRVVLPSTTPLAAGDLITVTATMSDVTTVVGSPKLALDIGANVGLAASYVSGSGTTSLVFVYTVLQSQANNLESTVSVPANPLNLVSYSNANLRYSYNFSNYTDDQNRVPDQNLEVSAGATATKLGLSASFSASGVNTAGRVVQYGYLDNSSARATVTSQFSLSKVSVHVQTFQAGVETTRTVTNGSDVSTVPALLDGANNWLWVVDRTFSTTTSVLGAASVLPSIDTSANTISLTQTSKTGTLTANGNTWNWSWDGPNQVMTFSMGALQQFTASQAQDLVRSIFYYNDATTAALATRVLTVNISDADGNVATGVRTFDGEPPVATVLTLASNVVASGANRIKATQATGVVTATTELSGGVAATFSRSGGGTVTKNYQAPAGSTNVSLTLSDADLAILGDGVISVVAWAVDQAGNSSVTSTSTSFSLDATPPVGTIYGAQVWPQVNSWVDATITVLPSGSVTPTVTSIYFAGASGRTNNRLN